MGWDSKAFDLAPRESRAGKWLLTGLLQFCTSRSGLSAMKLLALELFHTSKVAGTQNVSGQAETVATARSPLMPREGVSHGLLLGFEKPDHSLLARSKGKTSAFQGGSCCFSIMDACFSLPLLPVLFRRDMQPAPTRMRS